MALDPASSAGNFLAPRPMISHSIQLIPHSVSNIYTGIEATMCLMLSLFTSLLIRGIKFQYYTKLFPNQLHY